MVTVASVVLCPAPPSPHQHHESFSLTDRHIHLFPSTTLVVAAMMVAVVPFFAAATAAQPSLASLPQAVPQPRHISEKNGRVAEKVECTRRVTGFR
jgi:hypothetical protein